MKQKVDYLNTKFGRYTVIKKLRGKGKKDSLWLCVCDCGNVREVMGGNLRRGTSKSCGCLQKELIAKRTLTHGLSNTAEYYSYQSMKSRCYNEKTKEYPNWGGRGIVVCPRWLEGFENFFKDMGERPTSEHSLDRIDVNGNYCKENCRWGTDEQQHRNMRTNNWVEYEGEKLVVMDWAKRFGIPQATLDQRLRRGHDIKYVMDFSKNPLNKGKYLR